MARSQNGWPVISRRTRTFEIGDTGRTLSLRPGNAGWILADFAQWYHENIERVDLGVWDEWAWANRDIRGSSTISNHASGTAIDLNATRHPLGVRGTYSPLQRTRMRNVLSRRYLGAIRAGEFYYGRVDGMHFEIDCGPTRLAFVVAKIKIADGSRKRAGRVRPAVDLSNVRRQFARAQRGLKTEKTPAIVRIQKMLNKRYKAGLKVDGLVREKTLRAWERHEKARRTRVDRPNQLPSRHSIRALHKGWRIEK